MKTTRTQMRRPSLVFALVLMALAAGPGCQRESSAPTAPKESSAEAKGLADAARKAAETAPADAVDLAGSVAARGDLSTADREVAIQAQQTALKKLAAAAAAGDAEAQKAIDKYRASK